MSSSQRQTPLPIVPKVQSPAIKRGTDEIMHLVNRLLVARDSAKPALVHTEIQTDGREVEELKNKVASLQDINFSIQERMTKMERELNAANAKIAELTAENARLKETQAVNDHLMLSTVSSDDLPTSVAPQDTFSEHARSVSQGYPDFLSSSTEPMDVDDLTQIQDNTISLDIPDKSFLLMSAPSTPQATSPTLTPSSSPTSLPSPVPMRISVMFGSEYSSSSSEDTASDTDSDASRPSQCSPHGNVSPASPNSMVEDPVLENDLPFPPKLFSPTIIYSRQISLVVSPPCPDEDIIFYVNRPVSPATSEEASDVE